MQRSLGDRQIRTRVRAVVPTTKTKVKKKKAKTGTSTARIDVKQKFKPQVKRVKADFTDYPSGLGNKPGLIPQTGTSKRKERASTVAKSTKRINVKQKFVQPTVQGRGRVGYTDFPSGRGSKRGIIEQRGLARRENRKAAKIDVKEGLKQKSKVGNTGFLALVDRFFVRVNGFFSEVGLK